MTTDMMSLDDIIIGQTRIRDAAGYVGTVAYVGSVASSKDPTLPYLGVIWDDTSRGKHDGSVICRNSGQLVRHFHANHPTAGSFVKIGKVDFGRPLTPSLLRERYVDLEQELIAPNNILPHTVSTASGRTKPIEFVGEEKIRTQQQPEQLNAIGLRCMGISSILPPTTSSIISDWWKDYPIQQLDIAGNLLSDWNSVLNLLETFSQLTHLSLASNRLAGGSLLSDAEQQFSNLTHLNLRNCYIQSIDTVLQIAKVLPNLQEICLAEARLNDLDVQRHADLLAEAFSHLTMLDLSSCGLTSDAIAAFSKLPNLESLSLDDNPIDKWPKKSQHYQDDDDDDDCYFPKLRHLQLAQTQIATWTDLEELNNLASLRSLRLRQCPLLNPFGDLQARTRIVARFPDLEQLNASPISTEERQEAERQYVMVVSREIHRKQQEMNDKDTTAIEQEILSQHPQYQRLLARDPDLSAHATAPSGNIASSLAESILNVQIQSLAAQSCTMDPLVRRLPSGLTVGRLKALCARHFGLDLDLQVLHFSVGNNGLPVAMDDDHRSLAYYGVPDGAKIFMNEIDVEALERERLREQQELSERMQQQEEEITRFEKQKQQAASSIASIVSNQ